MSEANIAALSVLAVPENTLADMLSRSATFQAECGTTGDADATWDHIELTEWAIDESPLPPAGPYGVVYLDEGFRMRKTSEGAAWNYQTNGALKVYLRTPGPFQFAATRDQATAMKNFVGDVMTDLFDLSAVGDANLAINDIELTAPPSRVARWIIRRRRHNFWHALFRVDWGPD